MSVANSLNIDDSILKTLEKADESMKKLAQTASNTSAQIVKSFQDISTLGVGQFIGKVRDAETALNSLNNKKINPFNMGGVSDASKIIDVINKMLSAYERLNGETKKTTTQKAGLFGGMGSSVKEWEKIQVQIQKNNEQIQRLTQSTKEYELLQSRLQSGKSVVIQAGASKEYQDNLKQIEVLREQNALLDKKQRAIVETNKALSAQANMQQSLKQFNSDQTSLPEQRKNEELNRMNDYYRNLERSSKRALETIKRKDKEDNKNQSRKRQKEESKLLNEYNSAMKANEATINQRINKISKLRQVERQLASDNQRYAQQLTHVRTEINRLSKENDKATKSANKLNSKKKSLIDTSAQLQRKLALLFSVTAIQGYINKLVSVRGEFEIQQRSLQVLLQDKDEANKLWDRTVSLAVKSPFRVKELVTYTKQLTAYRIETDKLYDTNKMLADVSAGLGVDMNRLILAFGQVKAANYLRGTELRQFSEAGVNMLGELAKYFTELEGRAVSVGDVFERVSKRMVTFEHVETIFKRITSESGVFYRMQEKQSETLQGMLMNFRDSIDLMLNGIGKDQDSILKNSIRLAKEFVDNWRNFSAIVDTAATAFLAAFGVKSLLSIAKGLSTVVSIISANPLLALASAAALVATYFYQAAEAKNKLDAAMMEVESENMITLEENIELYRKLAETFNDATRSYEERNRAMDELENKFKDILPDQYLEIEYIEKVANNYREAEKAMLDYYNAKTREQKRERIEQEFFSELEGTDIPELIKSIKNRIDWDDMFSDEEKIRLKSGVSGVIKSVIEDVKNGNINNDFKTLGNEINKRLSLYSGLDFNLFATDMAGSFFTHEDLKDIVSTLHDYIVAIEDINGLSYETYDEELAAKMINKEKDYLNQSIDSFKKAVALYRGYINVMSDSKGTIEEKRGEIEKDVQKILNELPQSMLSYKAYLTEIFKQLKVAADKGSFEFASILQTIESNLYYTLGDDGKIGGLAGIAFNNVHLNKEANTAAKEMVQNFQEGLADKSKTLKMSDFQNSVIGAIKEITDIFGVEADRFAKFVPKYGESLSEVRQRVEAEIESFEDRIKRWNTSIGTGLKLFTPGALTEEKKEIDEMTKLLPSLKLLFNFLGGDDEKKKGGKDKTIDERLRVIDQMNQKYKELNKTLSHSKSLQGAFNAYVDAFATAYNRSDVKKMTADEFAEKVLNFPNEDAIVSFLNDLKKIAKTKEDELKVELKKGEYEMDLTVRAKVEDDKALIDKIEDLFGDYEISLELEKLNIPKDLAKNIFSLDAISLSDLKNKVLSMQANFEGSDMEDKYSDFLKKINEMEDKAQLERLKKYTQYLVKGQSERVKIKMEEIRQLSKLEELGFSEEQKTQIRKGIEDETKEKLSKAEWEAFKDTDIYIQMFEDLGIVSNKVLSDLKNKLIKMRGSLSDLDPRSLKDITSQIEKINRLQTERNPFDNLKDSIKSGIDAIKRLNKEQEAYYNAQKEQDFTQWAIDSIMIANERKKAEIESAKAAMLSLDTTEEQSAMYHKIIQDNKNSIAQNDILLKTLQKQLSTQEKTTEEAAKRLVITKEEVVAFNNSANQIGGWGSAATNAITEVTNMLTNWGVEMSYVASGILDGFGQMFSSLEQLDITKPFSILKSATGILAGFGNIFASIFGFGNHDRRAEKKIQSYTKYVEQLEKAYERLEKQINDAYSIDSLQKSGKDALNNITAQIESYEKMIEAENSKKKTDDDRVKEWKNEIEALENLKAEKEKELVSTATDGILDDVRSAAREFVDAWVDAFNETGDGLIGLKDNFKQNMLEMVKQQAAMLISQSYIERWKKQLEQYINPEDLELTTDEAGKWVNAVTESLPQLNEALEKYFTAMQQAGVDLGSDTSSQLSGLQRGIQEIQESTAQEIAAYLNSIRFFVSQNNEYLRIIAQSYSDTEMQNPMLSELRSQTELIRSIRDMFSSVIRGGHPTYGGAFLKVSL